MNLVTCPRCWNHRNPYCDKCANRGTLYDTRVTKNFTLGELTHSRTAQERRIPNDPTRVHVERLGELAKCILQPLRDAVGPLKVTSGFRTPELNAVLPGASKDSAHMLGYAADVQAGECTLRKLMYWFMQTKLPFDQAILEYGRRPGDDQDDWLHVGYKHSSGSQRRQLLVMRGGKYTPWVP